MLADSEIFNFQLFKFYNCGKFKRHSRDYREVRLEYS